MSGKNNERKNNRQEMKGYSVIGREMRLGREQMGGGE
jgi:hypothetical protein